jgi:N-acetylglutamate synthase-like GNAT family acetyltransferase
MTIEVVTKENFSEESLDSFNRTQYVKRIYRKNESGYETVANEFVMDWSLAKKRQVARDLLSDDCIAYVARDDQGKILGFAGAFRELTEGYMVVYLIHVDMHERRRGLGRKLFEIVLAEAKKANAKGLYISVFPAEETVNYYLAMGCSIADNPIQKFAEKEPDDVQMVFVL